MPGKVICPEDPTLTLYAKGEPGRCFFVEYDAIRCFRALTPQPDYLREYVIAADWVVVPPSSWGEQRLPPGTLREYGFEPAKFDDIDAGGYVLWKKTPPR